MSAQKGFTLIGVLISLLVLSVGILGLLRFQGMLFQDEIQSSDYAGATNLAQSAQEERRTCAPLHCTGSGYALPVPGAAAPLNRFSCKQQSSNGITTVTVRWTDPDGKNNTLALAAPQTDCSTEPEIPPQPPLPEPEECTNPTVVVINDVHKNATVTISHGTCVDLGGHPWHTWRCTSTAAQGTGLHIKIDGTGQGHDETFNITANCKENSVQGK